MMRRVIARFLYIWYGWIRFNQNRPKETIVWCRRGEKEA